MIEDKLSRNERCRLECLAQAIAYSAMKSVSAEIIVKTAETFERYVADNEV